LYNGTEGVSMAIPQILNHEPKEAYPYEAL